MSFTHATTHSLAWSLHAYNSNVCALDLEGHCNILFPTVEYWCAFQSQFHKNNKPILQDIVIIVQFTMTWNFTAVQNVPKIQNPILQKSNLKSLLNKRMTIMIISCL